MAECPNCGRKLSIFDRKPECPGCGVNLLFYNMEERLMTEADKAEAEHARAQVKYDHLRASFIGSKIAVIRLIASLLPIGALMLPLCSVIYSDGTTNRINAIELYKYLSSADIGSILSSVNYFSVALGCLLLSAVLVLVALFALAASCRKMGKQRNVILYSLAVLSAIVSAVCLSEFSKVSSGALANVQSITFGIGAYIYIGTLLLLLGINIYISIKGLPVKYKQCYIGGIPSEEYFELVNKGTDIKAIHEMMDKALRDIKEQKSIEKEAAEAAL